MISWEQYVEQQDIAAVGQWVDELADDPAKHPEDIANTVIDFGVTPVNRDMFDYIVDYVVARRAQ